MPREINIGEESFVIFAGVITFLQALPDILFRSQEGRKSQFDRSNRNFVYFPLTLSLSRGAIKFSVSRVR